MGKLRSYIRPYTFYIAFTMLVKLGGQIVEQGTHDELMRRESF